MNTGIYEGVSAMRTAQRRMEGVTSNLANLSTPAYKRRQVATEAFVVGRGHREHIENKAVGRVDFAQGELERTGNPLDLALMGDGFFAVEGAEGEAYTRNGSFRVDDQGVLVTPEGHMVAWDGPAGRLDPVGEPITIDRTGTVHQGATRVGQLKVVGFGAPEQLRPDGSGYWTAPAGMVGSPTTADVHQGAVERSNVQAVDELVEMIALQRRFESARSLMQMVDQSMRRLNSPR